ncbi:hypothetical protein PHYPSEUDO_001199 [Phytophthora pseudosyringae]|uniref:Uncharacterized protein n=1 Tax=Phytophthora pseudosyringae TaxID=221518 RepID=A0A8T1VWF1_9STRA|nr:hypothetical protein PHYPSEUDO_001199 [Phytophthora pseudosyringae]
MRKLPAPSTKCRDGELRLPCDDGIHPACASADPTIATPVYGRRSAPNTRTVQAAGATHHESFIMKCMSMRALPLRRLHWVDRPAGSPEAGPHRAIRKLAVKGSRSCKRILPVGVGNSSDETIHASSDWPRGPWSTMLTQGLCSYLYRSALRCSMLLTDTLYHLRA